MTTKTEADAFSVASDMEEVLGTVDDLLHAVVNMTIDLGTDPSAGTITRLADLARDHCRKAESMRQQISHLTHAAHMVNAGCQTSEQGADK